MYSEEALIEIVRELALKFGEFKLASGKIGKYYLDCRRVTLDSRGANLVAAGMLELLGDDLPDAVGGMAIGADPITGAVITLAGQQGHRLKGFIVRKESKEHGTGQDVEGPIEKGDRAYILEDVVTTGGSSLKAIEKAEQAGLKIEGVIAIVDRLAGGEETFQKAGYPFRSLLTIRDLGIED